MKTYVMRDFRHNAELVKAAAEIAGVSGATVTAKPWGCRVLAESDAVLNWVVQAVAAGIECGAI